MKQLLLVVLMLCALLTLHGLSQDILKEKQNPSSRMFKSEIQALQKSKKPSLGWLLRELAKEKDGLSPKADPIVEMSTALDLGLLFERLVVCSVRDKIVYINKGIVEGDRKQQVIEIYDMAADIVKRSLKLPPSPDGTRPVQTLGEQGLVQIIFNPGAKYPGQAELLETIRDVVLDHIPHVAEWVGKEPQLLKLLYMTEVNTLEQKVQFADEATLRITNFFKPRVEEARITASK
ncbi:MAG TPA: hypothetical protein VEA59_02605 [Patescibacteria group bacterium]|nr:hypothetical protein [Patescibacteria group bacterium]